MAVIIEKAGKWEKRFFEIADTVSQWSKDPSSKIGAVIADQYNRVISTGYNGFAVGVQDYAERLENREIKYKLILHAEENAIMFSKRDLSGCKLFVTNIPPCSHCASLIIQSGITDVYAKHIEIPERWKESCALTMEIFQEAGVTLHFVDLD